MSASGSPTASARSPAVVDLAASTASPSSSRSAEAAPPVAPVAPAPRVKLEGSGTASASSATASSLPSVSRSSAAPALTLADLERVLELRDSRLEFAQAERDIKLGKLVSYAVAKPIPEPSHGMFRRLQGSSSIDELVAALEMEIVGGPHPAVVAGEQRADAFAARARADLLVHELRETMKRVSQLEESEKTASALVRSLKEQVAQLENRNISLSSSDDFGRRHARSPSVSRSSAHPRSLSASARGSQSAPSSPTRNVIVRRPRSPSVARSGAKRQHSPDSDADSSGSALVSGHVSSRSSTSSRSRKKARATPTASPVSSKKSSPRRSTNKKAAKPRVTVSHSPSEDSDDEDGLATLRRPRRPTAANCSAIQRLLHAGESDSNSEVLGEAEAVSSSSGCDRQASSRPSAVSSTSAPPPSSPVTPSSPTQAPPGSVADLASANASVYGATKSVVIRALPPGKHPAWRPSDSDSDSGDSTGGGSAATPPNLSNRLVESPDPSGDASTLAGSSKPKSQTSSTAGSGSPSLTSPTVVTPPLARSSVHSATGTSKSSSASKAKAVVPARSAKDASKPEPASKAKSPAAIRSAKDGSKP
ncbi:unnamed protein product [Phytophthora fragariaefolia]|uniref:Unnamed protein product n=1 Tax=Phytophthora fragariaefolia TaxID=1490495 RepID=A0A9W6Y5I6_9STRA|nr:unnamed protein product [Phytophthora fragariaefolia]